ncbi:MAG: hypothetical protein ABH954_04015 [Candidatus Omnitrophota bacterium]
MKIQNPDSDHWRFYSLFLISSLAFLLVFKWSKLPTFIDIYYHLSVMLGFNEIGGFTTMAFWEYAPVGRPHLYPPLIHFLMLIFYKLNFSAITIARLFELIIYPAALFTLWWVVDKLFNRRLAFFTILISISIFSFYLSIINFIPATLATILSLLSLFFMEKDKIVASALLLGLAFYAHAVIPWIFLFSFILYSFLNKKILRNCTKITVFALIAATPILIYQYLFREYIKTSWATEIFSIEISLWLLLFIPGLIISLKRKGRYNFFVALFIINLLSMCTSYRYRFILGQGILGLLFLSSVALDAAYDKTIDFLVKKPRTKFNTASVLLLIILYFYFLSPTLLIQDGKLSFPILNSTYINLNPLSKQIYRPNEFSIYFPKEYKPIKEGIIGNSNYDDIVYFRPRYFTGLFSVLTGRATSTAMLKEVRAYKEFDPIAVSKLIIWAKIPEEASKGEKLADIIKKYNLKKIKETELFYIYENHKATAKRILPKPLLSNRFIFSILFLFIGLIGWDIRKRQGGQDGN